LKGGGTYDTKRTPFNLTIAWIITFTTPPPAPNMFIYDGLHLKSHLLIGQNISIIIFKGWSKPLVALIKHRMATSCKFWLVATFFCSSNSIGYKLE
jgi:hypothetical protein